MRHTKLILRFCVLFVIGQLLFSSCISQKQIKYMQHETKQTPVVRRFDNAVRDSYKIMSNDNLYITVASLDDKSMDLFNAISANRGSMYNAGSASAGNAGVYLNSYNVDDDGYIDFPIIGNVLVKDLTVLGVRDVLKKSIQEYIRDVTVVVKLVDFNVSVLGEVKRPGQFQVYQNEINIFEALALAGDIYPYGNRKSVNIIRKTERGSEVYKVDLTEDKVLTSEYFYLRPDDVIYVEPLKAKTWTFESFPYSLLFSAITTTLVLINFLQN